MRQWVPKKVIVEPCCSIYDKCQLKVNVIDIATSHGIPVETIRTKIRRISNVRSEKPIPTSNSNIGMLEKLQMFVEKIRFLTFDKLAANFNELTSVQISKITLRQCIPKKGSIAEL